VERHAPATGECPIHHIWPMTTGVKLRRPCQRDPARRQNHVGGPVVENREVRVET
jgi:hypothetical protein